MLAVSLDCPFWIPPLRYFLTFIKLTQQLINCDLNTSDIDNITMKDIFWTDLLKFFFELK